MVSEKMEEVSKGINLVSVTGTPLKKIVRDIKNQGTHTINTHKGTHSVAQVILPLFSVFKYKDAHIMYTRLVLRHKREYRLFCSDRYRTELYLKRNS